MAGGSALPTRMSEQRFQLLIDSVTDYAIYMLDPDGTVVSWNSGARRLKGYEAEEIIGRNFSTFFSEEDRAAGLPRKALETAAREGRFEAEGWRVRKDGSRFWASVVIDPIRDDSGRHVGFAKITRDLTERKLAAEALEQSREHFFQSQKLEAIGKLTGGVAHDFNNILAAIMGSLGLAQRRLAHGEDVTRFLDNAMQAAKRGATLTQRMLAFARKQELQLEPVDMIASVRDKASGRSWCGIDGGLLDNGHSRPPQKAFDGLSNSPARGARAFIRTRPGAGAENYGASTWMPSAPIVDASPW